MQQGIGKGKQSVAARDTARLSVLLWPVSCCLLYRSFSHRTNTKNTASPRSTSAPAAPRLTRQLIEQYRLIVRDAVGEHLFDAAYPRRDRGTLSNTARSTRSPSPPLLTRPGMSSSAFLIKRKTEAQRVDVVLGPSVGDKVKEDDLLFKLDLLQPGTPITEQTLRNNADELLDYLRERGFLQIRGHLRTPSAADRE